MARRTVTVDQYLEVALDLLIHDGPRALKVGAMCDRLGVTTGSFYGYFASLDAFGELLLARHLTDQNRRFAALAASQVPLDECLSTLRQLAQEVPHETERAIRAWAREHPRASALQGEFDEQRHRALVEVFRRHLTEPGIAYQLAELGMALLVGWQELGAATTRESANSVFDQFEESVRFHRAQP